jgi:hypothetical protein
MIIELDKILNFIKTKNFFNLCQSIILYNFIDGYKEKEYTYRYIIDYCNVDIVPVFSLK